MFRKAVATIIIAWLGTVGAAQASGDAKAGASKAEACFGCHGDKGIGMPPHPALASRPAADLVKMLKDFKSGAKVNPVMSAMAGGLEDQDMEDLAAYFASVK
jgi:cytochrome c553